MERAAKAAESLQQQRPSPSNQSGTVRQRHWSRIVAGSLERCWAELIFDVNVNKAMQKIAESEFTMPRIEHNVYGIQVQNHFLLQLGSTFAAPYLDRTCCGIIWSAYQHVFSRRRALISKCRFSVPLWMHLRLSDGGHSLLLCPEVQSLCSCTTPHVVSMLMDRQRDRQTCSVLLLK